MKIPEIDVQRYLDAWWQAGVVLIEGITGICTQCGLVLTVRNDNTCPGHHRKSDPDWAAANRVMCDLLHRGIVPKRIDAEHRR